MKKILIATLALVCAAGAQAASEEVTLHEVTAQGIGAAIGKVTISETPYGLQFAPALTGLKPGIHGFHVHAKGSCEPGQSDGKTVAAGAAVGIWIHKIPVNILDLTPMAIWAICLPCMSLMMARPIIPWLRHELNR